MKYTPNFNLAKPENNDAVDIGVPNGNADKVDTALAAHATDQTKHIGTGTKATPVDADSLALVDSADAGKAKKLSLANLKTFLENTFASLGSDGKIPASQLPTMNYIPTVQKGAANGVAELGSDGKVPAAQLPAYVDDVLEYVMLSGFPAGGESGKIYVALDSNKTYRWSGSSYVEISASLALGETASTAYRGDRGKTAYDHSQASGNPHGTTAAQVGAAPAVHAHAITDVSGLQAALNAGAKVATGNYTGTGTFGPSNKNSLTFPFSPSLVLISCDTTEMSSGSFGLWFPGLSAFTKATSYSNYTNNASLSYHTLSWYTPATHYTEAAGAQLNASGISYKYIALGI